ncbi:MAG: MFS transporter [Chloroflexi bacterium]|nr:MFS transporter [Chloroflexota bacterium]
MKKLSSFRELLVLNIYWVGLSFKWNVLHPLILPALLLNYVPDGQKNSYLGLLTFCGLLVAAIIQPLSGALSDGWVSRWGKRRPLLVIGTLIDVFFLALLGWGGGLLWIFLGYVGLQVSSNLGQGPAQGLLPDRVAAHRVGAASGLKTFMDMTALIIASLAAGHLFDPRSRDAHLIILLLIGVVLASVTVTVLGTPEEAAERNVSDKQVDHAGWWPEWWDRFRVGAWQDDFLAGFRANASYWWLIIQRGVFLLGIYGLQAFAQYYLRDVLEVTNPVKTTGDLLAALTVALVLLSLAGGWLADKFGAKRILYAASFLSSFGFVLLWLARSPSVLVLYGFVLGAGIGLFLTSSWALANQLAPAGESGKYLGLTNLATAGAGALARLEGPLIDGLNAAHPGLWLGYLGMFAFGALCTLLSAFLLNRVTIKH